MLLDDLHLGFSIAHELPRSTTSFSTILRTTRHGFPAAKTPSGMFRVTTLPAPITVFEPMTTPGQMIAPPPTQTSEPIVTGLPNSCERLSSAFIGCVAV